MSSNDSKDDVWSADEEVWRAYEDAGFHEEPPAKVDRAILATARGHGRRRAFTPWLAPTALAATVLVSLSIVIRLGFIGADDPDLTGPGRDALEEVQQGLDEIEGQPPAVQSGRARASSAVETEQASGTAVRADEPSTVAPEALRSTEAAPTEPAPVQVLRTQELAPGAASSSAFRASAPESCETVRSGPETWLQCIVSLLDTGATELAASELSDFRASHPDYPLPADLEIP